MEKIEKWLIINKNDNSGSGSYSGYNDGSGSYSGYNDGDGSGSGDGDGIKALNKQKVYIIDNTQTIIKSIHKNIARGFILNSDLTLKKCYIAKGQNKFAHGETIKEALRDLEKKIMKDIDTEEIIKKFKEKFKENKKYAVKDFYEWHHYLTGSCEMGRKSFAKDHNINIDKDKMSPKEFIELTENSYGGEIIAELKKFYGEEWYETKRAENM